MMTFISAFVVCGGICLAGQLIYDNTKLTAGHITSIFVVIGAALDTFGWYDKLLEFAGMVLLTDYQLWTFSDSRGACEGAKRRCHGDFTWYV